MADNFKRAIELLAAHTRAKGAARILFMTAILELELENQRRDNYGWSDTLTKGVRELRQVCKSIARVQTYVVDAEASEEAADEGNFYRNAADRLLPPLQELADNLELEIRNALKIIRQHKKSKRGQTPLHNRLDALADLWAEQGGTVSGGSAEFEDFLRAGSSDVQAMQSKRSVTSTVGRFKRRKLEREQAATSGARYAKGDTSE